jgi:hypothetical protein
MFAWLCRFAIPRVSRGVAFVEVDWRKAPSSPIIAKTFPLNETVEAHWYMGSD